MEIISATTAAASIVIKLKEFFNTLSDSKRKAKGMKYKILDEIQFNVRLLGDHYIIKGLSAEKVIKGLKVTTLKEAFESGFKFKELSSKNVSKKHIGQNKFFERYLDMTLEKYLDTIKNNIEDLKFSLENYDINDKNSKVRFNVRLKNLVKKFQLLQILLKDK